MRSRGSVLAAVLVLASVAAIVGLGLFRHARRSARTAAWAADHVGLRLLADSALEELFARLSEAANTEGTPAYASLRARTSAPLALDAPLARAQAGRGVMLAIEAELVERAPLSPDPVEQRGVLCLTVTATRAGPPLLVQR